MARIIRTDKLDPDEPLSPNDAEWIYNGLDCCVTLEVLQKMQPILDNTSDATYQFSRELQAPVLEMNLRGMLVDKEKVKETLDETLDSMSAIAKNLKRLVVEGVGVEWWDEAAWGSNAKVGRLFYDVMEFKEIKKRRQSGAYTRSADRDALEQLSQYFYAEPLCNHIIALRELDKVRQRLQTPTDSDGRWRSSYNVAGTDTGRLSSSASEFETGNNMQNVDRNLRSTCIADPGMKMGNFDLEQADARNVGAICWNLFFTRYGPEYAGSYLDACESGDLHTRVCSMGWPNLEWTGGPVRDRELADTIAYRTFSFRDLSKKLGHGTNYIGQPPTMAIHTKSSVAAVDQFQRNYFLGFPCIGEHGIPATQIGDKPNWHNSVKHDIREYGYLTTLLGRRRYFFGRGTEASTIRKAVAFEPQSLTADEIDTGLVRLWRANRVQLLAQVHDNVLVQYPEEQEDELVPWIIETLKVYIELKGDRQFHVPVEAKTGWNWGDVKFDEDGNVVDNPDGLLKWKGGDTRKRERTYRHKPLSVLDF